MARIAAIFVGIVAGVFVGAIVDLFVMGPFASLPIYVVVPLCGVLGGGLFALMPGPCPSQFTSGPFRAAKWTKRD